MQHVFAAFCQPAAPRSALSPHHLLLHTLSGRRSRCVQQQLQKCGVCRCECLGRWYDAFIHRTACSDHHSHTNRPRAHALFKVNNPCLPGVQLAYSIGYCPGSWLGSCAPCAVNPGRVSSIVKGLSVDLMPRLHVVVEAVSRVTLRLSYTKRTRHLHCLDSAQTLRVAHSQSSMYGNMIETEPNTVESVAHAQCLAYFQQHARSHGKHMLMRVNA